MEVCSEKKCKMDERKIVNDVLKNLDESTNNELIFCMKFLNEDFEQTKNSIIKLTKHLDNTELLYNKIFKIYQRRINGK